MHFISYIFRGIDSMIRSVRIFLRICRLRLIYPGLSIDFASNIQSNCDIKCVKGGRLVIKNSDILSGTQILASDGASIFIDNAFIGRNCVIVATESIEIGQGCLLAEMVVIRDQDHLLTVSSNKNIREGFSKASVRIEKNVWLASKATILKGVNVGENSVIAASAVININIPANEVWGGIPGRFIKKIEQ